MLPTPATTPWSRSVALRLRLVAFSRACQSAGRTSKGSGPRPAASKKAARAASPAKWVTLPKRRTSRKRNSPPPSSPKTRATVDRGQRTEGGAKEPAAPARLGFSVLCLLSSVALLLHPLEADGDVHLVAEDRRLEVLTADAEVAPFEDQLRRVADA